MFLENPLQGRGIVMERETYIPDPSLLLLPEDEIPPVRTVKDEQEGMEPEVIGRAVLRQLRRRSMKPEVTPTFIYSLLVWAIRRFPQGFVLRIIGRLYS